MEPKTVDTVIGLASTIKQRRLDKGWTQQELANKIGRSRKWVVDLEQGKTTVELLPVLDAIDVLGLQITLSQKADKPNANNAFPGIVRRRPEHRQL